PARRSGHAFSADDNYSDEAALDVLRFVSMGMIEPHDGTRVVRARASALGDFPDINVSLSGRDAHVVGHRSAIIVTSTLGTFRVEDSVRMHGEGMSGIVLEDDADGVAHFRAQHRSQHPEMLPLR